MAVTGEDARQLNFIYDFLDSQCIHCPEQDINGIYTRIISSLVSDAEIGWDIEQDYSGMIHTPSEKTFSGRKIREIALRKFARYCYYELHGFDKEQPWKSLRKKIHSEVEAIADSANDWYAGLGVIAGRVSRHFGTPIRVEK
jgi:hypothetical protein